MKDSFKLTSTEEKGLEQVLATLKLQMQEDDVQKAWTNCTSCWGGSCANGFTG
jgi:hypothetical protein